MPGILNSLVLEIKLKFRTTFKMLKEALNISIRIIMNSGANRKLPPMCVECPKCR